MHDLPKHEGHSRRPRFAVPADEFLPHGAGDFECGVKIRGAGVSVRLCQQSSVRGAHQL